VKRYGNFIGGAWSEAARSFIPSCNPYTQQPWAEIPEASEQQVHDALESARRAFLAWRRVSGTERSRLLHRLAALLDQHADRFAVLETTDNGKVIRETRNQMGFAARNYRFFAGFADKLYGSYIPLDSYESVDYAAWEPVGVCVLLTAWNSPIQLLSNKLAPALAAGNTVVIKPSEYASVTTLEFMNLVQEAGFPPGVVNVVTGDGAVGALLCSSPVVARISFTGGTQTGRAVMRSAAQNLLPVTLELGGKSPNIVFADADLERAVQGAVAGIFGATGQTCMAGSRLLVQESVFDDLLGAIVERAKRVVMGNPLDPATEMGPVCTIMVGRLDDWLKVVKEKENVTIDPGHLEWAGVATFKRAHAIYRERGYRTRLLSAAFRNQLHWSELIGGDVVISPPPEWQRRFAASGLAIQSRIDTPVDPRVIDDLSRFADFRRAYAPDGLTVDEFDEFAPTRRTLRQFLGAGDDLRALVRDIMIPNPDR